MKLSTAAIAFTTILPIFAQFEEVCDKNMRYCEVTCDKLGGPEVNICSEKNMNFDCVCNKNHYRPTESYGNFPVAFEKCSIELTDCNDKCESDASCLAICSRKHRCIGKDPHDGNKTQTINTPATKDKPSGSATSTDDPKLNNGFTNVPAFTLVAGALFTLFL